MILCFKKGDCPGLHTDETLLVYTEYRYRGERFMKTLRRKKRWPRKSTTKPRRYNGSGKRYQAVSAIHRGGAKNMGQKRVSWYEKAKGCWYISEDNRTANCAEKGEGEGEGGLFKQRLDLGVFFPMMKYGVWGVSVTQREGMKGKCRALMRWCTELQRRFPSSPR